MPWSPTRAFPHPLANINSCSVDESAANYFSFALTESLMWLGLGDLINTFRTETLGLRPVDVISAAAALPRLGIPFTYCWLVSYLCNLTLEESSSDKKQVSLSHTKAGRLGSGNKRVGQLQPTNDFHVHPAAASRGISRNRASSNIYWVRLDCAGRSRSGDTNPVKSNSAGWSPRSYKRRLGWLGSQ